MDAHERTEIARAAADFLFDRIAELTDQDGDVFSVELDSTNATDENGVMGFDIVELPVGARSNTEGRAVVRVRFETVEG